MKILLVTDKKGSAIDILANFIKRYNKQHEIEILNFHPKRPDEESVAYLLEHIKDFDFTHWMYWRSWDKAAQFLIPHGGILSHFNPYDINERRWDGMLNVVCTEDQLEKLPGAETIRLAVDDELWEWNPNEHKTVGMCAARIESKKGVLEVAQVCKELGYKFIIMGRISNPDYWREVRKTGADIEFYENVPVEKMNEIYNKMGVFVVNSIDNFETGPMPPFEAVLTGVPIVSRKVGTIGEIGEGGKNVLFFDKPVEMALKIRQVLQNDRSALRNEGWRMAKNLSAMRFARSYNKLYHEYLYPDQPLVSVICPYVPERKNTIRETIASLHEQSYKNIEVLSLVDEEKGYNLAKLRNKMIVEAHGEYLLFLDDRWKLSHIHTVKEFIKQLNNRDYIFLWGDKGSGKRNFVENFSFCKRDSFIKAGMWNERIDHYGGMSQEIRARLRAQGWKFKFCEGAKAVEKMSSRGDWRTKAEIIKAKNILYKMGL